MIRLDLITGLILMVSRLDFMSGGYSFYIMILRTLKTPR